MGNLRFSQIHPFSYRNMQQFLDKCPLFKNGKWIVNKQNNTCHRQNGSNDETRQIKFQQIFKDLNIVQ